MIACPECGADMKLRNSRHGKFYGCSRYPNCTATHGAHQDTGGPLGIPANKETRELRIKAHDAFDALWKDGHMSRPEAYCWMQREMRLTPAEAHIGRFSAEQCQRLIDLATRDNPDQRGAGASGDLLRQILRGL